jgi:hypothetical protein
LQKALQKTSYLPLTTTRVKRKTLSDLRIAVRDYSTVMYEQNDSVHPALRGCNPEQKERIKREERVE